MGAPHALSPSGTGAQAVASRVAALVCSAVSGAEDPRTLAITILNCAPVPRGGRVDLFPRLIDEAASYELVDDRGVPVPHTWIGEPGRAPSVLTLARSELPDLPSALARALACLPPASHVAELSVWTSGQTVHLEVTAGEDDAVDDADIGDAAILAGSLARRAACARACITVHQSASMHLAAAVGTPVVALYGITDPSKTGPLGKICRVLQNSDLRARDIPRDSPEARASLAAIHPEQAYSAAIECLGESKKT